MLLENIIHHWTSYVRGIWTEWNFCTLCETGQHKIRKTKPNHFFPFFLRSFQLWNRNCQITMRITHFIPKNSCISWTSMWIILKRNRNSTVINLYIAPETKLVVCVVIFAFGPPNITLKIVWNRCGVE